MKRSILILVLTFFSLFVNAQIPKGTRMIGTRLNYYQNNNDNNTAGNNGTTSNLSKSKNFNGSLNGGYFIKDNLVVGLVLGYGNQSYEYHNKSQGGTNNNDNSNNQSTITFSTGVYGRVYKMMKENKIGFFGNMDVLYGFGKSNTETKYMNSSSGSIQSNKGDVTGYSLSLSPGVVYFITDNIGLEASYGNLSYRSQTTESTYNDGRTGTEKIDGINFNFSVSSLNVGINFYLRDKKN